MVIVAICDDSVFKIRLADFLDCKYIIFILSKTIYWLNLHDCALLYRYGKNRLFIVDHDAYDGDRMRFLPQAGRTSNKR